MAHSNAQLRKVKKPMIERRRRERINECLKQLKQLVLEATDSDPSRLTTKMEKAEILEMTVAYLRTVHGRCRGARLDGATSPAAYVSKSSTGDRFETASSWSTADGRRTSPSEYIAGFSECVLQVQKFLGGQNGSGTSPATGELGADKMTGTLPQQLLQHLAEFVSTRQTNEDCPPSSQKSMTSPAAEIAPSPDTTHSSTALDEPVDGSRTTGQTTMILPRFVSASTSGLQPLYAVVDRGPYPPYAQLAAVADSTSGQSVAMATSGCRCLPGVFPLYAVAPETTSAADRKQLCENATGSPVHHASQFPDHFASIGSSDFSSKSAHVDSNVWRPWGAANSDSQCSKHD